MRDMAYIYHSLKGVENLTQITPDTRGRLKGAKMLQWRKVLKNLDDVSFGEWESAALSFLKDHILRGLAKSAFKFGTR